MPILSYQLLPDGLHIHADPAQLLLTVYASGAVRVRYTERAEFNQHPPEGVIVAEPDPAVPFSVLEQAASLVFATDAFSIEIDRQTLACTYRDADSTLLTREPSRGGKQVEPVTVLRSVFADATITADAQTVDGVRLRAENLRQVVDRQAYHTRLAFEWADGEALYGLGSHDQGLFNLRGQREYLYQQNLKAVVPVLVSTRGYGILLNSTSLIQFHDDEQGSFLWTDVDDELDFVFLYGPEFDQIVAQIRLLTGPAPMLPRWAFGYVQSKERYVSQAELVATAREFRERGLPLDCIVLDWKSWPGDLWGQKSLDPERFPDPHGLAADLQALHTRWMVSIWPNLLPGGENWLELERQGFLLGNRSTYDAFNPAARACYWQQANRGLFTYGVDAWWCDCTEPFEADWHGPVKPDPEEQMRINVEEAKRFLDPEFINAYSLLHSEGLYAGQRSVLESKRVVNLTRSAFAGQQRYATITWSGDTAATWETLRRQIPAGLNFCVTGQPYWTVDIGAFFVKRDPALWFWCGDYDQGVADWGYRELYVRWFQYGAFLPMFRAHGTDTPREIWHFGEPGEPVYDTLVRYLKLRYRLLPYLYSLAGQVTQSAYTMLRALAFDFRQDPNVYDCADQFLLGPALLVCPVTQPMYFAAGSVPLTGVDKTRPVYLPAGCDWYDFWTGQRYPGGQTVTAAAPLETLPLYVRAGSILPIGPQIQFSGERPDAPIELWIYPGQDGEFTLYADEGDGYHYEQGQFATVRLQWDDRTRQLTLGDRQGSYPGMPGTVRLRLVLAPGLGFDPLGEAVSAREIDYAGQKMIVTL